MHACYCILLDRGINRCPSFPLCRRTSYYIYCYILLSTFPNFTSSSWNLWPARWGITIHRRIKKHTLREHLHVHSRRQPIIIANQMFELPTQPLSTVRRNQMSAQWILLSRMTTILIQRSLMLTVQTLASPPCPPISKTMICTTHRSSYIYTRRPVIRQNELQWFYWQRNGAMPILSSQALHFEICDI